MAKQSQIQKAIAQLEAETDDLRRRIAERDAVIGALKRSVITRVVKAKHKLKPEIAAQP